ncbi:Transcriptional regulator of ribosomal biogenesis protein [Mortierella alpina]|nr:Transcriptional regulator of ribosomal biogenesis protein [Mortierella alpina]
MSAPYYPHKALPAITISRSHPSNLIRENTSRDMEAKPFVAPSDCIPNSPPALPSAIAITATAADTPSSHPSFYPSSYSSFSSWNPMDLSSSSFRFEHDAERQQSPSFAADNVHAREFETAFCRDFHQTEPTAHYEECHVRFEEEEDDEFADNDSELFDEDGWSDSDSAPSSPSSATPPGSGLGPGGIAAGVGGTGLAAAAGHFLPPNSYSHGLRANHGLASHPLIHSTHPLYRHPSGSRSSIDMDLDPTASRNSTTYALDAFTASFGGPSKRKAVVSLADIYSEDDSDVGSDIKTTFLRSKINGSSAAHDVLRSNAKRQATASNPSGDSSHDNQQDALLNSALFTHPTTRIGPLSTRHALETSASPYVAAAVDLMRQRDEVFSLMEDITRTGNANAGDKPYRCTVLGCDKAYKNPNGLKYHNLHGHCSSGGMSETDSPETKPYVCTFLECGKRYKNLNGLKYHIEHSHPNLTAALRAHQSGLVNPAIFGPYPSQAAMTIAAALQAVNSSPMMMAAANAIMTAQAANAANAAVNATSTPNNGGSGLGSCTGSGATLGPGPLLPAALPSCPPGPHPTVTASINRGIGLTGPPGISAGLVPGTGPGTAPRLEPLCKESKSDSADDARNPVSMPSNIYSAAMSSGPLSMTVSAVPTECDP